jgi:glycosyltransferase involved in cell wall biosynthesis
VFEEKRVGVVVPAYDEEELIGATLGGIPPLVDRIIVVNDGSSDRTAEVAKATGDGRVEVISHERRSGVGAATVTGYRRALAEGMDVVVVMNGEIQMDAVDLPKVVAPFARVVLDDAKSIRLATGQAWQLIPKTRFFGNAILSMLTKVASGYWHVADSQSGYTVVSREMLELLDLDHIYTNYGFPNDMLVHLNVWNARVRDFPSRPIYGVGERSNMRYRHVVPRIAWLLVRGFFWRLWEKYVKRDFHPLVFFYAMGFIATVAGMLLGLVVVGYRIAGYSIPIATVVLVALLVISGLQFTLFAMWFDMESNKDLK